jgi:hypothetical protein
MFFNEEMKEVNMIVIDLINYEENIKNVILNCIDKLIEERLMINT